MTFPSFPATSPVPLVLSVRSISSRVTPLLVLGTIRARLRWACHQAARPGLQWRHDTMRNPFSGSMSHVPVEQSRTTRPNTTHTRTRTHTHTRTHNHNDNDNDSQPRPKSHPIPTPARLYPHVSHAIAPASHRPGILQQQRSLPRRGTRVCVCASGWVGFGGPCSVEPLVPTAVFYQCRAVFRLLL